MISHVNAVLIKGEAVIVAHYECGHAASSDDAQDARFPSDCPWCEHERREKHRTLFVAKEVQP